MAKKVDWIQEQHIDAIHIKVNDNVRTPVANIAVPHGWQDVAKWKKAATEKANLIQASPNLLRFAKEIEKVGEGHAPSVGYMTELVLKAKAVIKLAEGGTEIK